MLHLVRARLPGLCRRRRNVQCRCRPVHGLGPEVLRLLGELINGHRKDVFRLTASRKRRRLQQGNGPLRAAVELR